MLHFHGRGEIPRHLARFRRQGQHKRSSPTWTEMDPAIGESVRRMLTDDSSFKAQGTFQRGHAPLFSPGLPGYARWRAQGLSAAAITRPSQRYRRRRMASPEVEPYKRRSLSLQSLKTRQLEITGDVPYSCIRAYPRFRPRTSSFPACHGPLLDPKGPPPAAVTGPKPPVGGRGFRR